ncbi:small ribosomal subunit protein uS15m isoform X2 [Anguilla rostrata]|uniref:small ribosomal subunit protein uS15m isoform X2 n=1 Tax=Anguilla rostrata TaxID=7938 RepID=UPI0030D19CBB
MFVRCALKSASFAARESCVVSGGKQTCSALVSKHVRPAVRPLSTNISDRWASNAEELKGGRSLSVQPVRSYAEAGKKDARQSQLDDLPAAMLKKEYAAVPQAQMYVRLHRLRRPSLHSFTSHLSPPVWTDDVVRRLLTLDLASHKEKLRLKEEQLVAKVRLHENDSSSLAVKVAVLTARIRNYQEHLQQHPKVRTEDKANKRRMLMSVDRRKKMLKNLRSTRYDVFESVCTQLGIAYAFPPEYYRRVTHRWLAKKALCIRVFNELQKRRKEHRRMMAEAAGGAKAEAADKASTDVQGRAA